jgi:heme exporter protein D
MSTADGYWAMGGYAAYVWPAYAVAVVALVLLLVTALRSLRQAERELARIEGARAPRRMRARADKPAGDLA